MSETPREAAPLKLRRIRAGVYRTLDGHFDIVLDERCGLRSWLVYDSIEPSEPVALGAGGALRQPTLREARELLADKLSTVRLTHA